MSDAVLTSGSVARDRQTPRRRVKEALNVWSAATSAVATLVALPVIVVVASLLAPKGAVWGHLAATILWDYVGNSLGLMVGVAIGAGMIGVATAWLVTMCRFPGRAIFEWALLLPLAMPTYVIAYTYAGLLDFAGPVQSALRAWFGWGRGDYWFVSIRSLGGAIAVFSLVLYPYVYMLARAAFIEQSVCVLEVSRTLGDTPWRSFRRVVLPLARPAIAAGLALALMEALNDFGAVQHFAIDTFTTGIYRAWFGLGEPVAAAQLGAALLLFVFLLLWIEQASRGQARYHHTSQRYRALPGYRLYGWRRGAAAAVCFVPLGLGFLLPAGVLSGWAVRTASTNLDARFLGFAVNSLTLAAAAACFALILAFLLAYSLRQRATPLRRLAARIAAMGYAVPGSVIAVGTLLPLARVDQAIDAVLGWVGVTGGLFLSGSIVALIYAYLVRFLAVAFSAVEAGLAKVTPNIDGASRTLGESAWRTVLRVHLPMMRGSALAAALLVFVDVMKELPATLLMRPFNFDTLAVRVYQLANDERLQDAAAPALVIVLIGIGPVILLSRAIARSRPGSAL